MEAVLQRDIWKETPAVKSRIASYWDGRSDSFKIQRDAELHSEQHQLWQEELLSHLPEKKGLRILDVGCGCGFFSLMLAECGHQVTGIDLTESMILRGRELVSEYGVNADLRVMDAENLEFDDETFDVIVTRNLTWTLPHPKQAYEEWLRVLKPGGILLNYDAEHAKYHSRNGLEGEEAHKMLSGEQMDECMKIYHMLPISGWKRPAWDVCLLKQMGCGEVTADEKIGRKLYRHENEFTTPYPIFRIKAVKESKDLC